MFNTKEEHESWVIPQLPRRQKETWRTASQRAAYHRLEAICAIDPNAHYGNISPRTRAIMLTGPAGAGKTSVVRAYAALHGLPMFSQLASAYIPTGALQPASILAIRDFVRANPKGGFFYFDEVDKLCVGSSERQQSSWAQGVLGEVLSLLDLDGRLISLGWSPGDVNRFRRNYRIVASGAFQHVDKVTRTAAKRGALGFGTAASHRSYSDVLAEEDAIPEEIRFRFYHEAIHIDLPTREDFREGIKQIHEECEYHEPITEQLLTQAVESRRGVRWLEGYLAKLLMALEVEGPDRDEQDETEEQAVRHLGHAEYAQLHGKLSVWVISLRQALFKYEAALILALDRPSCSSAICCLIEEGWQEHPALLTTVRELQEAVAPLEANTMDSNRTYALLQGLSFATKFAIQKQAAGLQRAGLLAQTVAVRELANRIETVMKSLIGVEVS